MISLEETLRAIDSNVEIALIKEQIKNLVTIFNTKHPNVDLSNFAKRIMDLKITQANKLVSNKPVHYNLNTNTLSLDIDEKDDAKNLIMHGLINIITSNDFQTGFDYNDRFTALNEGYTQMITNMLVGNDSDINYFEEEMISTNLVCHMVDVSILEEAFFNNDSKKLASILMNQGVALDAIELLNYRYKNPNINIEVDSRLAKSFFSRPRTEEEIEGFMLDGSCSKEAELIANMSREQIYKEEVKGISRIV